MYQIESGACHGRGFAGADPNGFLGKFYAWVTTAPGLLTGGPGWFIYDDQSAAVADPYIVVCDIAAPVVNAVDTGLNAGPPKFIKVGMITTEAGFIHCTSYFWWDNAAHIGYGIWNQFRLATYDDADFAYDFRGGTECMIIQARTGATWSTFVFDEWTGDANLVEGTDKYGILDGPVVAGASVVIQLHAGEAANFTQNKYYYIYDFDAHTWVNYVKVTNVNLGLDRVTVDSIAYNFPDHAVIGAYVHRWIALSNGTWGANYMSRYVSVLPYSSGTVGHVVYNQSANNIYGYAMAVIAAGYIDRMMPNDEGAYAVMRPGIVEGAAPNDFTETAVGMNRGYGIVNNVYVTILGTMSPGLDGRIVAGNNWLFFKAANALFYNESPVRACLFLDTRSV